MIRCEDCAATFAGTIATARRVHRWEPKAGGARPVHDPVREDEPWICAECLRKLLRRALDAMRNA